MITQTAKRGLIFSVLASMASMAFNVSANEWGRSFSAPNFLQEPSETPAITLPVDSSKPSQLQLEQQIEFIDQEILVLKAELAMQYGDVEQVKQYLRQLGQMVILPVFQQRIAYLKVFAMTSYKPSSPSISPNSNFSASNNSYLVASGLTPISFPFDDPKAVVAILLPLTGDYGEVGNQLLDSLSTALDMQGYLGSVVVFDTASYGTAFALWEVLKYYEPKFIFGPMQRAVAEQWQTLRTQVPTLYFNKMPTLNGIERALTPSKVGGVHRVGQFLGHNAYRNTLVLMDTKTADTIEPEFYRYWSELNQYGLYIQQPIEGTVGESLAKALNIDRSKARHRWLERVTGQRMVSRLRSRQDLDSVVSFVSDTQAMQVSPLIQFYGLEATPHVWLPSTPIQPSQFWESLS